MVYGHRPKDWAPLTGGDPCPGDPEAWAPVVGHYEQRVEDLRRLQRDYLLPHTSIDAEGHRFRRLEQVFSDGAQMLEMAAEEFSNAAETVKTWQNGLREMQEEADEALRKAREQQFLIEGYAQKVGALLVEANKDSSPDPIIATQVGFLMGEINVARALIAAQQSVVDGVRRRYKILSGSIRTQYHIRSVGDMYLHRKMSNPMSDSHEVFTNLIVGDESFSFDVEKLNRLAGEASNGPEALEKFLDELKKLSPEQLVAYLSSRPDLAMYPLEVSDDTVGNAVVVKNWWAGLSQEKRDMLANSAMAMVGNLEGVPYSVRVNSNRRLLDTVLKDPDLAASPREKLEYIRKVLESTEAGTDLQLTSLDLSNLKPENEDHYDYNDVLASISLGDLERADKVSVVVPGMDNNVSSFGDLVGRVGVNIYNEQQDAKGEHGDEGKNHAVEIWIGYETPPNFGQQVARQDNWVVDLEVARAGGQRLAAHLDGMNVTKSEHSSGGDYSDPQISVIAHSYGTTTMGQASQYAETTVDSIVMYGSAGIGAGAIFDANGDGWNVDRDSEGRQKIYYTSSIEDWTAPMGYIGSWLSAAGNPLKLGDVRATPVAIGDADRFQSTEGISAEGKYYEDVDTHSFETEGDDQGFVDTDTTSLYYGARAAAGYEEDLGERFYEPWYYEYDPFLGQNMVIQITKDDLDESGRVPDHLMEKVRKSQNIPESDLVSGDADD